MSETKLRRADVIEKVVLIIADVTGADLGRVFPDTRILSIQNTDRSDLAEICFQIEQAFDLRDIVGSQGYHNMDRAGLEQIMAGHLVDFVCQEVGA